MKSIIKTVLVFLMIGVCYAQSEPESIKGKDLLEKIDRSDLESNDMDNAGVIENEIPKMEMPILTFEKKSENKIKVKKVQKPVVQKTEKKYKTQETAIKESKATTANSKAPAKTQSKKPNKKSIIVSGKTISLNRLLNNDKIVVSNGVTYIYRFDKSKTIQYKLIGELQLKSSALKANGQNSYYIKDVKKLISDSKISKVNKMKPVVDKQEKQPKSVAEVKDNKQPIVPVTTDNDKKQLEKKHNHGRTVSGSIELKQLMKNDIIHIMGNAKLVIRRDRNTYEIHKYWLNGELDLRSRSLRKQSDIKYKVLKEYAPR